MQSSESDGNSNLPAPVQERGLGQWSPFDLFNQMKSEMDRVFGEFRPFARSGQWSPALDVYSEGDSTVPGQIALQRMRWVTKSAATDLVRPMTAALLAQ